MIPRFGSRKFFSFWFSIFLLIGLPILYWRIGIDTSVQLLVIGAIASVTLGYNISNVLDTKWSNNGKTDEFAP